MYIQCSRWPIAAFSSISCMYMIFEFHLAQNINNVNNSFTYFYSSQFSFLDIKFKNKMISTTQLQLCVIMEGSQCVCKTSRYECFHDKVNIHQITRTQCNKSPVSDLHQILPILHFNKVWPYFHHNSLLFIEIISSVSGADAIFLIS